MSARGELMFTIRGPILFAVRTIVIAVFVVIVCRAPVILVVAITAGNRVRDTSTKRVLCESL